MCRALLLFNDTICSEVKKVKVKGAGGYILFIINYKLRGPALPVEKREHLKKEKKITIF